MPDPLTIAASALSIAASITSTVKTITIFVGQIRDARQDLNLVKQELVVLESTLELLAQDLQGCSPTSLPASLSQQVDGILNGTGSVIEQITEILVKCDKGQLQRIGSWVISGQKERVDTLRQSLNTHNAALDIALGMLTLTLTREIKADTSVIRDQTETISLDIVEIKAFIQRLESMQDGGIRIASAESVMLQRYLDGLTVYAESVSQPSVLGVEDVMSNRDESNLETSRCPADTAMGALQLGSRVMSDTAPISVSRNGNLDRTVGSIDNPPIRVNEDVLPQRSARSSVTQSVRQIFESPASSQSTLLTQNSSWFGDTEMAAQHDNIEPDPPKQFHAPDIISRVPKPRLYKPIARPKPSTFSEASIGIARPSYSKDSFEKGHKSVENFRDGRLELGNRLMRIHRDTTSAHISELVARGADINLYGARALLRAFECGNLQCIRVLLLLGATLSKKVPNPPEWGTRISDDKSLKVLANAISIALDTLGGRLTPAAPAEAFLSTHNLDDPGDIDQWMPVVAYLMGQTWIEGLSPAIDSIADYCARMIANHPQSLQTILPTASKSDFHLFRLLKMLFSSKKQLNVSYNASSIIDYAILENDVHLLRFTKDRFRFGGVLTSARKLVGMASPNFLYTVACVINPDILQELDMIDESLKRVREPEKYQNSRGHPIHAAILSAVRMTNSFNLTKEQRSLVQYRLPKVFKSLGWWKGADRSFRARCTFHDRMNRHTVDVLTPSELVTNIYVRAPWMAQLLMETLCVDEGLVRRHKASLEMSKMPEMPGD